MKLTLRTRPLKEVRNEGLVPGVMFGKSIESTSVEVDAKTLKEALKTYGKSMTFQVTLDKKKHNVYIKGIKSNILKPSQIIHFDLHRIAEDETVGAHIPVVIMGKEILEKNRMYVQMVTSAVECEYLAGHGISSFEFDVSEMQIGDAILIKDLKVSDAVTIHHDPETVVFFIKEAIETPEEVVEVAEVDEESETKEEQEDKA